MFFFLQKSSGANGVLTVFADVLLTARPPSCPSLFRPQHLTVPSSFNAQVWKAPVETWVVRKYAKAVLLEFIVTVQVGAPPLHTPPQPPNAEPAFAVAVRVIEVPLFTVSRQSPPPAPQIIPAGALETLPIPMPPVCTVSVLHPASINHGTKKAARTDAREKNRMFRLPVASAAQSSSGLLV
ncbi:MAG TPA: hypothetical protein VFO82_13485 [Steroidobacteraceae bacterium]|nr:hypothetical protein [Steroidobacteraceae bacterium]